MSAHLAVDENLAAVGRVEAVGDAHGGRLPRAVLADDGVNGAGLDLDVDVSLARTVPKRLVMFLSCSITETSHRSP